MPTELKVKVAQADNESDVIVGALARANGCCAVSKDSDFFIFELPFGYIPIDNLEVTTNPPLPASLSKKKYHGRRYEIFEVMPVCALSLHHDLTD
jgi:hypothetical protein